MNDNPEKLNGDEVIIMVQPLIPHDTFQSVQFLEKIKELLYTQKAINNVLCNKWLSEGETCKALFPNQDWREGKLRIKLEIEFLPDQPDPIEDIETKDNKSLDEFRS